jgi:hypothetical protein
MSDNIQLAPPDNEPQPRGRENMKRMVDYTSKSGQRRLDTERRRQLTRQQLELLLRRHLSNPRRLGF